MDRKPVGDIGLHFVLPMESRASIESLIADHLLLESRDVVRRLDVRSVLKQQSGRAHGCRP